MFRIITMRAVYYVSSSVNIIFLEINQRITNKDVNDIYLPPPKLHLVIFLSDAVEPTRSRCHGCKRVDSEARNCWLQQTWQYFDGLSGELAARRSYSRRIDPAIVTFGFQHAWVTAIWRRTKLLSRKSSVVIGLQRMTRMRSRLVGGLRREGGTKVVDTGNVSCM